MKKLRRITDVLMTLVLLFLMGYQLWSEAAHEWAGVAMVLLFLLHQVLNRAGTAVLHAGVGRRFPPGPASRCV